MTIHIQFIPNHLRLWLNIWIYCFFSWCRIAFFRDDILQLMFQNLLPDNCSKNSTSLALLQYKFSVILKLSNSPYLCATPTCSNISIFLLLKHNTLLENFSFFSSWSFANFKCTCKIVNSCSRIFRAFRRDIFSPTSDNSDAICLMFSLRNILRFEHLK